MIRPIFIFKLLFCHHVQSVSVKMFLVLPTIALFSLLIHATAAIDCPRCAIQHFYTRKTYLPLCRGYAGGNWKTCNVPEPRCFPQYKYRTFDGSCNNLVYPTTGMTGTVFRRVMASCYQDSKHQVSEGVTGQRPSARLLSTTFFPGGNNTDDVTLAVMQWGQVVAHDLGFSMPVANSFDLDCCDYSQETFPDFENVCLPIKVPKDDYFYSRYNVTCISTIRTNWTHIGDCSLDTPAEQVNSVSHVMDLSIVYGSTDYMNRVIREFTGGKLKALTLNDGRKVLPHMQPLERAAEICIVRKLTDPCFEAGDLRVNQNSHLTSLQIVFFREHNRIAEELQVLQPLWDDETLFQEARSILIAQMQHITYGEWMKYYIGTSRMIENKLLPRKRGYTTYMEGIDISTINSFAAAAYRIGHSGIQGHLKMLNYNREWLKDIPLGKWSDRPLIIIQDNNYDELLLGLINQHMQVFDNYYAEEFTNKFTQGFAPYGVDILSLDIQRGRDHGLAPYVYYVELCSGYRIRKFRDLELYIFPALVAQLKRMYKSVYDIDLLVAGIMEHATFESRLGPTFTCLVTEQFYRIKWGDRFWYEVKGQPHSFTKQQLREIRKASLSRLMCNSGDRIAHVAYNSFLPPSINNRIVHCTEIPALNLSAWA